MPGFWQQMITSAGHFTAPQMFFYDLTPFAKQMAGRSNTEIAELQREHNFSVYDLTPFTK